jgi:hypothetical protein
MNNIPAKSIQDLMVRQILQAELFFSASSPSLFLKEKGDQSGSYTVTTHFSLPTVAVRQDFYYEFYCNS